MIVCLNCKHSNMAGTVFCAECGSQLAAEESLVTQAIKPHIKKTVNDFAPMPASSNSVASNAWASLYLVDVGQILPLTDRNEYTLGRVSEGQPIMPDIDLSTYQAYASGVSRLHAVIKRQGQRITVMDLGSANGTYLNGKRLNPNVEQIARHGDMFMLGKLKLQIIIKE